MLNSIFWKTGTISNEDWYLFYHASHIPKESSPRLQHLMAELKGQLMQFGNKKVMQNYGIFHVTRKWGYKNV
jgi:hypothetical protein